MNHYGEHLEGAMAKMGLNVIAIEMDEEEASGDYTCEARVTNRANGKSAIVGYLEADETTEILHGVYEVWDSNGMNGFTGKNEREMAMNVSSRMI